MSYGEGLTLRFEDVWYWYESPDPPALQSVNLIISKGQFLAVLGPNGAGKTTLLKLACGLLRPKRGTIAIENLGVCHEAVHSGLVKRRIGYIPQRLGLIKHLTVWENVLLGRLGLGKWTSLRFSKEDHDAVLELLQRLGLHQYADRKVSSLSGGEQQRVAIARALVRSPHLLVADEITADLDVKIATMVMNQLTELCTQQRVTILASIHSPELALSCARLILGLRHGRIQFCKQAGHISSNDIWDLYGGDSDG